MNAYSSFDADEMHREIADVDIGYTGSSSNASGFSRWFMAKSLAQKSKLAAALTIVGILVVAVRS